MKRVLPLLMLGVLCAAARADSPSTQDLIDQSRAVYGTLESYADRGEVFDQFGPKPENSYRHTFRTYFRAPRNFLFDFTQDARAGGNRIVIWCDGGDFQSWSSATQQHATYPRGSNTAALAFQQFASSTGRAVTLIPALVFQGSGLVSSFGEFGDAVPAGNEAIGGAPALKLNGVARSRYEKTQRETNVRHATVWIDPQTHLLRRILEDTPDGLPPTAVMRITTTLQPQANPTLADSVFQFTVPTAKTTDPCSLLTADEVRQALFEPRVLPRQRIIDRAKMCDYELEDESVGLSVWLLPATGLDRARKEYPQLTAVQGLDQAFIHRNERFGQTELFARKGNATLQLSVPTPDGDADARGDAARLKVLARLALARLPAGS